MRGHEVIWRGRATVGFFRVGQPEERVATGSSRFCQGNGRGEFGGRFLNGLWVVEGGRGEERMKNL